MLDMSSVMFSRIDAGVWDVSWRDPGSDVKSRLKDLDGDAYEERRAAGLPGSRGEHLLQLMLDTRARAENFYTKQVLDHLNKPMREFIGRQEMAFIATSDARGECDCSFRAGQPGFIKVLDDWTLGYPEYRGNGVLASLGNITENPHVAILMVDFFNDLVGLHVNGRAQIMTCGEMDTAHGLFGGGTAAARPAECWVKVSVEEAYIHCSKHIPLLAKEDRRRRVAEQRARPAGPEYFTGQSAQNSPSDRTGLIEEAAQTAECCDAEPSAPARGRRAGTW